MKIREILVAAGSLCVAASVHAQFIYVTNNGAITLTAYSGTNSSATVPGFVTSIGPGAFAGNTNLATVYFGGNVTNVGNSAFGGCSGLIQVPSLANGITFGSNVFAYCGSLGNITLSGTSVGVGMFQGCTNVLDISLEGNVTNIGSLAFSGCTRLASLPTFNAGTVFGSNIFSDCSGLTSVSISWTNVPNGMFANCTNLAHVSFSSSVTNIGSFAFNGCSKLTTLPTFNSGTVFGSNVLAGCGFSSVSLTGFTSVPIGMFSGCTNLTSIYLGSISNIGDYAFSGCAKLQTLPSFNAGTVFGSNVFSYCGFSSVDLYNMGTLPIGMFQGCANLSSIDLGTITNLSDYSLSGTALTGLPTLNSATVFGAYVFSFCTNLTSVYFDYTNIPDGTFDGCSKLSTIALNFDTAYVGSHAFSGCARMTSLPDFNSGVIFGSYAFSFCTGLTGATYYGTSIPDGLFEGCSNLATIDVEDEITNVGNYAFDGCSKLVECPSFAPETFYGSNVFSFCTSLPFAEIYGVNVGGAMFEGCTNISGANFLGNITNIGSAAFYGCTALTHIDIPAEVTSIGLDAFGDCPRLTSIGVDPDNSNYASVNGVLFNEFDSTLVQFPGGGPTNYTLPGNVTNIGADAFDGDTGLTGLVISGKVNTIGANAFNNCSGLIGLLFAGNAPANVSSTAFTSDALGLYYLPGATGWGSSIDGITPRLWNPQIETNGGNFGLSAGQFGFAITGAAGIPITVAASTNLAASAWTAVQTCAVTNGSIYFTDPSSTGDSNRFYTILFP